VNVEDVQFGEPPWYLDAAELLSRPDPGPTPWLVDGLIVDQALVAVVGKWKTTKSYGMLDVSISIATGRPAFGVFEIPKPGPVVFVNEESGEAALWRRLDVLCRGRAIDHEEFRGRLFVAANRRVRLDDPDWQARLIETGKRLEPRMFVFDPLARMKAPGRKENAQEDMSPVIDFWRLLRDETGAAVALVNHTGHDGGHIRGTSDMETAWETRLGWSKSGSEVTVKSEHRDADAAPDFKYRIDWDGRTRSMRFEAIEDPFEVWVRGYLRDHPDASGNKLYEAAEGRDDRPHKSKVHTLFKSIREGGSEARNHPGTTPSDQRQGSGSQKRPSGTHGTTLTGDPAKPVPKTGTTPLVVCSTHGRETRVKSVAAGVTYLACGCFLVDELPSYEWTRTEDTP
jgi:hypothetical protein